MIDHQPCVRCGKPAESGIQHPAIGGYVGLLCCWTQADSIACGWQRAESALKPKPDGRCTCITNDRHHCVLHPDYDWEDTTEPEEDDDDDRERE